MANTIELGIVVDDNGSLKLVTKEAQAAGKALGGVSTNAHSADRSLKGTAKASSNATKNFAKQAQGLTSGLVPAYATLAANLFAAQAAFGFLRESADYVQLLEGQEALTMATGIAYESLAKSLQTATANQITFAEASRATAIGLAAGLSSEQLQGLGDAALTVSRTLGRDVNDSFNRLIRGVTKAEPELLDELGIILRLEEATNNYAQALNINANDLTQYQRSQAVVNEVLTQAEEKYSKINEILDPTGNSIRQLGVAFEAVARQVGVAIVGPASAIADFLTKNIYGAIAALGIFASTILQSAIPSLDDLESKTAGYNKQIKNLDRGIEGIRETLENNTKATERFATTWDVAKLRMQQAGLAAQKLTATLGKMQVLLLRLASSIAKVVSVVGILTLAFGFIKDGLVIAADKFGLLNQEMEKNKGFAQTQQESIKQLTTDFERFGRVMEEVPLKTFNEQLSFLGNAANSANINLLRDSLSTLKNLGSGGMMDITDVGSILKTFGVADRSTAEMQQSIAIRNYLVSLKAVMPEVQKFINTFDDTNTLTAEQVTQLEKLITKYRTFSAIPQEIAETQKQELEARRSLLSSYAATPFDSLLNLNERLVKLYGQRSDAIRDLVAQGRALTPEQEAELRRNDEQAAISERLVQVYRGIRKETAMLSADTKNLAIIRERLSADPTKMGQRQLELLQVDQQRLAVAQKELEQQGVLATFIEARKNNDAIAMENASLRLNDLGLEVALEREKLAVMQQQTNEMVQLKNNATKAFEGTLQNSIAQAIKGEETSVKKLVSNIAKATLNSVADSLAEQMTRRISGFLFGGPGQEILNAFVQGSKIVYNAIVGGLSGTKSYLVGGPSTKVATSASSVSPGGGVSATTGTAITGGQVQGVFSQFMTGLKGLFSGNAPFLQSLGNIFAGGLKGFGSLFSDLLGGIFGGGSSVLGMVGGFFGLARGGVMPRGYASGGIVKEPTFLVGEGRHNEAVVPLPDGRSIPVSMPAGAAGVNNVTVNVAVDNNGNASTQTQMDDQRAGQLGKLISAAVQDELQKQKRPGGILSPYGAA